MFSKSAHYYDAIYSFKDYPKETETIRTLISREKRTDGNRLLDVACGTGLHMLYLSEHFEVEGIDLDGDMLGFARHRVQSAMFHQGDMADFNLGSTFDVVICLFSSIGYLQTTKRLNNAIRCMADHLVTGGVMIVEPWYTPENWHPGTVHAKFIDEPELKIARANTSYVNGIAILFRYALPGRHSGGHRSLRGATRIGSFYDCRNDRRIRIGGIGCFL